MAQGKKCDEKIKQEVLAHLAVNNNVNEVAREMKLSWSTVDKIRREAEGDCETLKKLREQKKQEFIQSAWRIIEKSSRLIEKKLTAADEGVEKIDAKTLSTVLGTIYDKQALASAEPTQIVEGKVEMIRFEDL